MSIVRLLLKLYKIKQRKKLIRKQWEKRVISLKIGLMIKKTLIWIKKMIKIQKYQRKTRPTNRIIM